MDDLLADFVAETREMLEAIGGEIVAWEANPSDRARLDAVFRFVHTVKGNCGFFDFPRLEKLSHAAESTLAEVRAGRRQPDSALVTAVLSVIDKIGLLTDRIENGEDLETGESDDALIAALEVVDHAEAAEIALDAMTDNQASNADEQSKSDGEATKAAAPRTIRLPVAALDALMNGVSDMVLARNDLSRRLREAKIETDLDAPFERLSSIVNEVREGVSNMRMQRVDYLFNALPRLVRDLSAELGKQVMLDLEGGDVELDREMIEMIRDPLTHIIRNAIDHGLETPSERLAAGKREIGMLHISARQSGNKVWLMITDDGRGIDIERVTQKALSAGITTEADLAKLSDNERAFLIFEPGLSTAESVSSVSGRGVGMDVVRANIEALGGDIKVKTNGEEGTIFFLQIPLTLSIVSGVTVRVGEHMFAVPRHFIDEIESGSKAMESKVAVGDGEMITHRGERIPFLRIAKALQVDDEGDYDAKRSAVLITRPTTNRTVALEVDEILDHEDMVVKPLAQALVGVGLYAGTILLDDGSPILMLDIPALAYTNGLIKGLRARSYVDEEPETDTVGDALEERVMVISTLDGRRRAVRLPLVRRIETVDLANVDMGAATPRVRIGEDLLPLAGMASDASIPDRLRLLRLSDGDTEIAYAVASVIDTIALTGEITPETQDPAIEGVTILDDEPTELLDALYLFANHARAQVPTTKPVCAIAGDAPWIDSILAPLIRSAGYELTRDPEAAADVAIIADDTPSASDAAGSAGSPHTIRLRAQADPDTGDDGTIYRYDGSGLMAALRAAPQRKSA